MSGILSLINNDCEIIIRFKNQNKQNVCIHSTSDTLKLYFMHSS